MIGAASYLLAVVLLGFGGAKLFHSRLRVTPRLAWIALFIVSAACLFQLQTSYLQRLALGFQYPGARRLGGLYARAKAPPGLMGGVGSVILLSGALRQQPHPDDGPPSDSPRPARPSRDAQFDPKFGEWQCERRLRKADWRTRLSWRKSQRELASNGRSIEKQLKTQGAPVPEAATASVLPEELTNRPKPKVVDTTALPEEPARKKPSLAELRGAEKKAKAAPAGLANQTWDAENYVLPGFDLLDAHDTEGRTAADPAELEQIQKT